ncbi:17081_t:CDS:2, partial [Funneliformis geosporum]
TITSRKKNKETVALSFSNDNQSIIDDDLQVSLSPGSRTSTPDSFHDMFESSHQDISLTASSRTLPALESRFSVLTTGTSKSPNGLVFIFVDNSNLFIKGKYTVGNLEKVGTINRKRGSFYFNELRFDHGCLLSTEHIRSQGFKVVLYDRNVKNKEKKIDTSFVVDGMKVIMSEDPGIFVLIAGDGDYYPMILEALYRNWKVEVWFWTSANSSRSSWGTRICDAGAEKYSPTKLSASQP